MNFEDNGRIPRRHFLRNAGLAGGLGTFGTVPGSGSTRLGSADEDELVDLDLENDRYDWDLEIYESADDRDYLLSLNANDGELSLPDGGIPSRNSPVRGSSVPSAPPV